MVRLKPVSVSNVTVFKNMNFDEMSESDMRSVLKNMQGKCWEHPNPVNSSPWEGWNTAWGVVADCVRVQNENAVEVDGGSRGD